MSEPHRIAVIGAGIAGLSAAWALHTAGHAVTVFEASSHAGGVIRSTRQRKHLFEHGPNSIQPNQTVHALIDELGLRPSVLTANPVQRNRFVVRDGRLLPLPLGPGALLRSSLFTWRGKGRLLAEPFIGKANGPESVADFVQRRVGREFLQYAINPFVAGVFAGDPERLSMQHAFPRMVELERDGGSLVRGLIAARRQSKRHSERPTPKKDLISFREGMATLPTRIAEGLGSRLQFDRPVRRLTRDASGWRVEAGPSPFGPFDAVIACVPYHRLHALTLPDAPLWPDVEYPPLTVVGLGYARTDVRHPLDGFGVLVPEVERNVQILGALFSSSLFPNRASEGEVLITVFLGGMRHADAPYLKDGDAVDQAHADLTRLLGIDASPRFSEAISISRSIPQYGLRHQEVLDALDIAERRNPGLFFAGNFRGGVSVVDTITNARTVAELASAFLVGRPASVRPALPSG